MLRIYYTNKMKKDARRMQRRGKDMAKLAAILSLLASGAPVQPRLRDHPLSGTRAGFRECHVEPDWLLVYRIEEDALILTATETGTHADLFGL